jgi:hypothetical protein
MMAEMLEAIAPAHAGGGSGAAVPSSRERHRKGAGAGDPPATASGCWRLRVWGPLPRRPGERGEFVMVARETGHCSLWALSPGPDECECAAAQVAELVRIRLADVDLAACRIRITQGKGSKDRVVPFPAAFKETLALHIDSACDEDRYRILSVT